MALPACATLQDASVTSSPTKHSSEPPKPIYTLILDTSPLLLNTPPLSTLVANSQILFTTPAVLSEIRDPAARSRIDTTYLSFLTQRTPSLESVKFVRDFARRTGDLVVLSDADLGVLALAYQLECERMGGDWRLRRVPGQRRVNGEMPRREEKTEGREVEEEVGAQEMTRGDGHGQDEEEEVADFKPEARAEEVHGLTRKMDTATIKDLPSPTEPIRETLVDDSDVSPSPEALQESDSDSEGWITPSNIKKHQAKEQSAASTSTKPTPQVLQVATMTGDFAMQNVLLQMNLNLVSTTTCKRISRLKQTILRCHGCFVTTKDMNKQFCPRCGKPTLTRVTCTTNDKGEVNLHLKKNMQWNNKGNVYSIPKPVSGTANQKWLGARHGGGQGGWGRELILAEDQKEFVRATAEQGRGHKPRDLMDEDYLPDILTGRRGRGGGRARIGGGRNVNSRKR